MSDFDGSEQGEIILETTSLLDTILGGITTVDSYIGDAYAFGIDFLSGKYTITLTSPVSAVPADMLVPLTLHEQVAPPPGDFVELGFTPLELETPLIDAF